MRKRPRYKKFRRSKKKRPQKRELCAEELTVKMQKNDKEIKKLKEKLKESYGDLFKSVEKMSDKADKVLEQGKKKSARENDRRFRRKRRRFRCYKTTTGAFRCKWMYNKLVLKKNRNKTNRLKRKSEQTLKDAKDNSEEIYSEAEDKFNDIVNDHLQQNLDELTREFSDFMVKNHPKVVLKEKPDELLNQMTKYKVKETNRSWMDNKFDTGSEEVISKHQDIKDQITYLENDNKKLIKQQEHLCNPRNPGRTSCPDMISAFKNNPSLETFEQMIKTIDGLKYSPKGDPENLSYAVVTTDNYKKFKKVSRSPKFYANQKQLDRINSRYDKAKKAVKNYEYNKKNAGSPGFKPKKVNSVCGSCRAVRDMFNQAKESGDIDDINKIVELNEAVGCGVVRPTKSCDEQVHRILNSSDHKFSYYEDMDTNKDDKKYISLDMAFRALETNPKVQKEKFTSAFSEVIELIQIDNGESKSCGECTALTNRIDELGSMRKDDVPEVVDGENIYHEYFQIDEDKKDKKDYFKSLRHTALKLGCIEPNEYREPPENNCNSKAKYFKDLITSEQSLDHLDDKELDEYQAKLVELNDFQSKKGVNCCEKIVGDLTARSLKQDKEVVDGKTIVKRSYIEKTDNKFRMAEVLKCVSCGNDANPKEQELYDEGHGRHTNCKFYKNVLQGLKDGARIPGLKKPDGNYYTSTEFKQNEIYTCSDGPKKSLIKPNRSWETIAYSKHGKYGDLVDYKLQCYINPSTGESVNLSCCNLTESDPYMQELVNKLDSNPMSSKDFNSDVFPNSNAIKQMNKKAGYGRAKSFCNDIYSKYQEYTEHKQTSGWSVCKDYNDNEIWRVNSQTDVEIEVRSNEDVTIPTKARRN